MHTPRTERDLARARRAALAARSANMPAMAAALAQIGTAFDEAAAVNAFKMRVERLMRLGPDHAAVRARFSARAERLAGRDLTSAMSLVERWWRDERRAFQITSAFGCSTRLSLEVLRELRLILRWMQFKRMEAEYDAALKALCDLPTMAAE